MRFHVSDGWARLEVMSFEAYNESIHLKEIVERYKERTGRYPSRILADKIYRNRANLAYCKSKNIRLSGPALGIPKKDEKRNKQLEYQDECERVEAESQFSLAKRKCGLGLIMTKLEETIAHSIALSVVVLNIRKIQHAIFQPLQNWLIRWHAVQKFVFIQ